MKKCKDCHREIDKYMFACDYCGKLQDKENKSENKEEDSTGEKVKEE